MRCVNIFLVESFALAAANPVLLDQLFSSDAQDLGNSPSTGSLFDPLYIEDAMSTSDLFSSPVSSDLSDSLLYTEIMPGDTAAANLNLDTTFSSEPLGLLFDGVDNSIGNDDPFAQLSQGEAGSDCIPDVLSRGIGKIRLGRSCSELKEDKKSRPKTCIKERSELCCCSGLGVDGAYNLFCNARTHTRPFSSFHFCCFLRHLNFVCFNHGQSFTEPICFKYLRMLFVLTSIL